MAHITLIRPPNVLPYDTIKCHVGTPPLSLAYLIGSLKVAKHDVVAIDALGEALTKFTKFKNYSLLINGLTTEEIIRRIPRFTDFIGLSCMFSNDWIYIRHLIKCIKQQFPQTPIIVGGEHVTAEYREIMKFTPEVSFCVLGEGEETIVDLMKAYSNGENFKTVQGIYFQDERGQNYKTLPRQRILKIDEIPKPSWDELPLSNYIDSGIGYGTYGKRAIPMLFSRGCPYECTFCTNVDMWGTRWIPRDIRHVINEIKYYKKRYKINHVDFFDATTIVNKSKIIDFCQALIDEKLDITWAMPSGTRSEVIDLKVLTLLKNAGLVRIQYAPESGSKKTLKRIKKRVNLNKMQESIRKCIQVGIVSRASLIFGFPGQTRLEVLESIWFALKMAYYGMDDLVCFSFVPYCGSPLYKELKEKKYLPFLKDDSEESYELFLAFNIYNRASKMKSYSEHLTDFEIRMCTMGLMGLFYAVSFLLRPWKFFQVMKRLINKRPLTSFDSLLYSLYLDFLKRGRKKKEFKHTELVGDKY